MIGWVDKLKKIDFIECQDPVTFAQYGKKKNLLDTAGWNGFHCFERKDKKTQRFFRQAETQVT